MNLIHGDCLNHMPKAKCIFGDPPDNIGVAYPEFKDKVDGEHYKLWIAEWLRVAMRNADIVWLSYNQIHDLMVCEVVGSLLRHERPAWSTKKIIWMYSFGQYNAKDFGPCYRPIMRLMSPTAVTYPDAVREESERMRLGDVRSAGPRVPGDVWEYPRVTGNSKERVTWFPTQHPVALYKRIMDFSCIAGDKFVDAFAGSGTCFRAGRLRPDIEVVGIDVDWTTVSRLREGTI